MTELQRLLKQRRWALSWPGLHFWFVIFIVDEAKVQSFALNEPLGANNGKPPGRGSPCTIFVVVKIVGMARFRISPALSVLQMTVFLFGTKIAVS